DGWIQRTTSPDTNSIVVDLSARLFRVNDDGSMASRSVVVRIQYREVGQEDWIEQGTIDAVIATHYWALLDRRTGRQVRYGSTNRSDHYDGQEEIYDYELWFSSGDAGIGYWQYRTHPYQLNQPWTGIAPNPIISPTTKGTRISGARQEPTRRSVAWEVPAGQYDVRVMKVTADVSDSRESNETAVGQILAVQTDNADYTGQARLAMRIKATGQLNGAVDEFNAIASAMCPVWDGGQWVTKETSNPAWWYLWFARGKLNDKGNRVYGAGMADTQIEIDAIKAWALWCDAKKLAFNYVLDAKTSTADVLRIIARAGRATPTFQTGRLGVIWDAENLPETAVFGPFNVKAGSFKIAYVNEGTVDEVVLNFVNEDTWAMDEVRAKVPGALA
ncbi:host specificity factor TipJ family phage tail protein, partial [Achromobacter denitrificans]